MGIKYMEKKLIVCSFYNKCKNYPDKCDNCKWNASIKLEDNLLLETKDGKSIRYLGE